MQLSVASKLLGFLFWRCCGLTGRWLSCFNTLESISISSFPLRLRHTHTHPHTLPRCTLTRPWRTHTVTWILSYGCLSCSNYMMCGNCQSLKRALQTHFKGSGARPRTQLTRSTEPRWAGGPRAPLPIVLIFTLISEYVVGGWVGRGWNG